MDAIIPLMGKSADLLNTPTGATALDRLFTALRSATTLHRVTFVGDDASLLARTKDAGFATAQWGTTDSNSAGVLPAGGAEALQHHAAEDVRTLLVSCANPLLTGEIIDGFVHQAEAASHPTVSVIPARDHPCQMFQHVRVLDTGVILPLALQPPQAPHSMDSEARLFTHPFRFMWSARQVRGKGPYFVLDTSSVEGLLLSVPDEADMPANGPLLVRESADTARLCLPESEVRTLAAVFGIGSLHDVAGIGLHLVPGLPCLSFHDADGADCIGFAAGHQNGRLCQIYARDERHGERRASLYLNDDLHSAPLPWSLDKIEPLSYTFMDYRDNDGPYDLPQSFPEAPHGLWSVDPVTHASVNNITGKKILGRQDFPEVLEPDGSLFALTPSEATCFDSLLQAKKVAPVLMKSSQSLLLRTSFDLLRFKAKLRMDTI
jgi:hypothetical protein